MLRTRSGTGRPPTVTLELRGTGGVGPRSVRTSGPGLPFDVLVAAHDGVAVIECGVALGVVDAPVCPAALSARERAARDQPGERMRARQQCPQAVRVADDARVPPRALAE